MVPMALLSALALSAAGVHGQTSPLPVNAADDPLRPSSGLFILQAGEQRSASTRQMTLLHAALSLKWPKATIHQSYSYTGAECITSKCVQRVMQEVEGHRLVAPLL